MLKPLSKFATVLITCLSLYAQGSACAADLNRLAADAKISRQSLDAALKMATYQQKIIDAITRPGESKPWYEYRKIFITKSRIQAGVDFYFDNEDTLKRAEQTYGVPPEIVCAIIGVETFFGRNMGTWKVLDALYTLGFHYPKREAFFSKEFANFVRLCQEQDWQLTSVKGSYAGAMGLGQFMPSSYLSYAVDFDGDGKINLFSNPVDAIGSVANYFKAHGWESGHGIYYPAHLNDANAQKLLDAKWDLTLDELYGSGATTKVNLSPDQKMRFFAWPLEDGSTGYSVGLKNFYVIMRYNTSPLYARAVYELAEFIRMEHDKAAAQGGNPQPQGRLP
ncbi:MAG: lytic murein transglycosylase B [Succinivibrio sp.]|nr:lytic murein transglycosylase B [Succinivibrio sp.]